MQRVPDPDLVIFEIYLQKKTEIINKIASLLKTKVLPNGQYIHF